MAEKARLTLDIDPALHSRLKIAAARKRTSIRKLCISAIERELGEEPERRYLTAEEAPLLAELWDNEDDAVYDNL